MSRVAVVVGIGLLALAFGIPMLQHAALLSNSSAPHGILSLQMTYSAKDARVILSSWSEEEARHAVVSLYWDMGFAIAYGWLLSALTRYCLRSTSRFTLVTAWVPILAAIADLVENLFHLILLGVAHSGAESVEGGLVLAGFVFASTKWVLLASWALLLLWGLAGTIFSRVLRKSD